MSEKVLIVDDKPMMRDSVGSTLQRAGFTVISAGDGQTALNLLTRHRPAVVLTDLKMPEMDGLELLHRMKQSDDQLPVVLMTAYGTVGDAVRAMKEGAFDFIQKPFEGDQLVMTIRRATEMRRLMQENAALKSNAATYENTPALVGRSPLMRQLAQQIQQIAHSQGTVLISGESGTGKEVVARTIHAHSQRRDRALLCVNCAALSSSLLESELFGHERGSFTGADQLRKGRFELADGGTLFLDEISEISPQLQAKLLRVLQERQFERVGSSQSMQVDVRVIATTNRDLLASVSRGDFRQDLYYRLNVLPIHLPPLRQRMEDVALLADHFLQQVALREGREAKKFDSSSLELMTRYPWPGNVRELQNICERASVLVKGQVIAGSVIGPWLVPEHRVSVSTQGSEMTLTHHGNDGQTGPAHVSGLGASDRMNWHPGASSRLSEGSVMTQIKPLEEYEREQIVRTLEQFGGNRQRTAEALGIGLRTLGLKLKKWKELNLVAQTL